ncbi:sugar phosphate isomerase/epimerase [Alicyclobacillus fastidiosus]|uniref:Sugar phosphate isomerase/epimerase n=1 Tax=Alicyclobacillus fastidiosus TaxID=392011 RepID=A0ABY6ZBS2_9BACL|nr:sugar phosphate isomerase/epimerase family protein [Alicyclobacillus fastidiosus]WAH40335.1 sugar phosphate isomerase/epimerase [Alicyclobacillus fastidiosus]GMA61720.1 xylose isomerase [Alicyclobacillus fastidiosus]
MFPFKTALNASTLFPFNLNIVEQVKIASDAGYEGIELWMRDIMSYLDNGGSLQTLKAYIRDSGISVVNAIAFFRWADKDDTLRTQGLLQARREMEILAQLGCIAVAAPPFGDLKGESLSTIAEHFAELHNMGLMIGVEPYLEFWGRAIRISSISESLFVLMDSGVQNGKLLLDPFHMYTGGSEVEQLAYINGASIGIVHVNDCPKDANPQTIMDKDRVFPGDGIFPSKKFAQFLHGIGYNGFLSLELFIEQFEHESALEVATYGLHKIQDAYSI